MEATAEKLESMVMGSMSALFRDLLIVMLMRIKFGNKEVLSHKTPDLAPKIQT